MLETNLDFDSSLDPYVIWYDGKKIITEGKIRDGAGSLLWDAPEQAGFYSIRLELFPFKFESTIAGIFREITLPVSAKTENASFFFEAEINADVYNQLPAILFQTGQSEENEGEIETNEEKVEEKKDLRSELLRWYQFRGNLYDSGSLLNAERALQPVGNRPSHWAAAGGLYGLSTGPDNSYAVSPVHFFRNGQDSGGGIFLLHIKPLTEGTILSVFFPHYLFEDGLWMDLARKNNAIVLRLIKSGVAVEIPVNLGNMVDTARVPVMVEFFIRQDSLEAKLSLGEGRSLHSLSGSIKLYDSLTGEARITLGGNYKYSDAAYSPEVQALAESAVYEPGKISTTAIQKEETAEAINPMVTIWGEFAIMHAIAPFIREAAVTSNQTRPAANSAQTIPAVTRAETRRVETQTERRQPVPEEARSDIPVTVLNETVTGDSQIEHDYDIEENLMDEDVLNEE
jgi:hypothetical protein